MLYFPLQPDHAGIPPAKILGARDIAAAVTGTTFARSILQITPQHIRMYILSLVLRTLPVIPVVPGHILLIPWPRITKPRKIRPALTALRHRKGATVTWFSIHAATS